MADKRIQAEKDYVKGMKYKDIAEKYGVSLNTVKSWKQRHGWTRNKGAPSEKSVHTKTQKDVSSNKQKIKVKKVPEEPIVEGDDLTDKQRLFCIYYVKSFNQTMAAIKAGYSPDRAHVTGSELVRNRKVADEIRRLKGEMQQGVFIDAMDVLNKYIQIAFADITDYATFGKKEVPVIGMYGPVKDEKGKQVTQEINYVDFKESSMVDGTIITEVKQGKDGISVKLADKMKAMDFLAKHFDMVPDRFKRQLEEEKLKIAHAKAFGTDEAEQYEDDGFNEALDATTLEVWGDGSNTNSEEN